METTVWSRRFLLFGARRDGTTAWMFEPIAARYNGTQQIRLVPRDQYDGLLLVEKVTPRKKLE